MRTFLKYVLATITGLFLFGLVSFVLMLAFAAALGSSADEVTIADNSVLELKLDKPITERKQEAEFTPFGAGNSSIGLIDLKAAIARAKKDDDIRGILLNLEIVQGGMASLEEVRDALIDFKKSGKFVVAYHETASEKSYYLSSVADEIYLHPQGLLEFNGLSSEVFFYKRLFDKLGVEPFIFRVGSFKSAVEPYMRESFSDSARFQTVSFLNSINDHSVQQIAAARKLPLARLKVIQDSMLVHNAEDAQRLGLVTKLGYYDQVLDYLRGKLKLEKDKKPSLVSLSTYDKADTDDDTKTGSNRIAVIYAEGDIVGGKGSDENVGGTKFADAIRRARLDDKVKAIVLRINSPGGSALASDVMYREVMLAKKVKPVIASMSDVAASGGYYLAMGCDTIVAHPNTITGSIGVFGVLPNLGPLLSEKLGITVDRVTTGKFSDIPTVTRRLSPFEQQMMQREVERIYTDFTSKAAQGRRMPVERLRRLASGRVWSGLEAKQNGLVDVLGDFDDALTLAARRANLKEGDYRIQRLPRRKSALESLLSYFDGNSEEAELRVLKSQMGPLFPIYQQYRAVTQMQGVQARLPYELTIQ
ncbi:signal peptide peptidase SppA [Hymenobacter sp. B81]|uniref:signal peptide peptidase SppA n=1 Tax=Hymenobacter sp. B81 TaxID=3344878 RepID=UPI0037DC4F89